jgi:sugar/nucleoside kinase (ribokinase family)
VFQIAGAGCCLLDLIYAGVDFSAGAFGRFRSLGPGDGGLEPGALVFTDDFERFSGLSWRQALGQLTTGLFPHGNIGGPAAVALIGAAQLLDASRFSVRFVGAVGADKWGRELRRRLGRTPLTTRLVERPGGTPFTYVLSDPRFDEGRGERTFINNIGAAWHLGPEDLDESFFRSDLAVFGGTALVPLLHDTLDTLLPRVKAAGGLTVVNTVYDFRSQRRDPGGRWPLGRTDKTYTAIDLLLADREEALRLSGQATVRQAIDWFLARGVGATLVTDGIRNIEAGVGSRRFVPLEARTFPVSQSVLRDLHAHPEHQGDTTGCGDNFAGGVITSLALQMEAGNRQLDLRDAAAWGAVCGGLACYHLGGVWTDTFPGEKWARVLSCLEADRRLV